MYNYEIDQKNRFNPNYTIGMEFEDYFELITKDIKGLQRAKSKTSIYDFQFYYTKIELKQRRYLYETFDSQMITINKFEKLQGFQSALYFNRFSDGRIYVANLKEINSPLEIKTYKANTGFEVDNYLIPSAFFIYLKDENSVIKYLKDENQKQYKRNN